MGRAINFVVSKAPAYASVLKLLTTYFEAYGGGRALVRSPYVHTAVVLTIITKSLWTQPGWWELTLAIIPNLVGFTLSGYAVVITIGDKQLKEAMVQKTSNRPSAFRAYNTTFFHFIIIMLLSIILALIAKSRPLSYFFGPASSQGYLTEARSWLGYTGWAVSYGVFMYALIRPVSCVDRCIGSGCD